MTHPLDTEKTTHVNKVQGRTKENLRQMEGGRSSLSCMMCVEAGEAEPITTNSEGVFSLAPEHSEPCGYLHSKKKNKKQTSTDLQTTAATLYITVHANECGYANVCCKKKKKHRHSVDSCLNIPLFPHGAG